MEYMNDSYEVRVAQTIIRQLGGWQRLKMMIGASSQEVVSESTECRGGVSFKFKGSPTFDKVTIRLNYLDYYDMSFDKSGVQETDSITNVHVADMMDWFESKTGLFLTLSPRS